MNREFFSYPGVRLLIALCLVSIPLVFTLFLLPTPTVRASTQTVTNTNDSGAGSLRNAISTASPGDTIVFSLTLPATITLTSQLQITKSLMISGPGASLLMVSGNYSVRVFNIMTTTVSITGLSLIYGNAGANKGGGINSIGSIINLTSTTLFSNTAAVGGAIYLPSGKLTLFDTNFISNATTSNCCGGAIEHDNGELVVLNSAFTGNTSGYGGAIDNNAGLLTISNSLFISNFATTVITYFGGGGAIWTNIPTTVTNSSFQGNRVTVTTGGAIDNQGGTLYVSNSIFVANSSANNGGAINNLGSLTVNNSSFIANSAVNGGSIATTSTLTITNSTFSGNVASSAGGGISTVKFTTITNSTIEGNSATFGGGICCALIRLVNSTIANNSASFGGGVYGEALTFIYNSIIANNPLGGNCYGGVVNTIGDGGGNIESGDTCNFKSYTTSMTNTNPLLRPLANNGGATKTMELLPGSPAIDAANDANCPSTDQRGWHRPFGTHCDIGAFERGAFLFLPLILR